MVDIYGQGLRDKIYVCEKCFCKPKRVLMGYGNNYMPQIAIVGTAPSIVGTEEDICPFQRMSKPIFDEILKVFNVKLEDVWVTNVVKCSKPNVEVGKLNNCQFIFEEEMNRIRPELIIYLGKEIADMFDSKMPSVVFGKGKSIGYGTRVIWSPQCSIFYYHPMSCIYNKDFTDGYLAKLKILKEKWKKGPEPENGQKKLGEWVKI